MNHILANFRANSGKNIFTQHWLPDGPVKAVMVIAHGLSEHSGRYLPLVNYFVNKGYAVYALDHDGHGQSEGLRGYVASFDHFVDDLNSYISEIKTQYQDTKILLVGHSMGGIISVQYLLKYPNSVTACILSGAALATDKVIGPVQKQLLKLFSMILPKVPMVKLEGEAVSRDPAVVKAYETDPLVFRGKGTARLLAEIVKSADSGMAKATDIALPLLILHGGHDLLENVSGSQRLFDSVSSEDKTLKIYPGFYHEIFLEKENVEVFADIEQWLSARYS